MRPDLILPNNAPNHASLAAARDSIMSEIRVGASIQIMAALLGDSIFSDPQSAAETMRTRADTAVAAAEALVIRLGDSPPWRMQP